MRRQLELEPEEQEQPVDDVRQQKPDGVFPDPSDGWVLSTEVKIIRTQVTALVAVIEGLRKDIERLNKL